MPSRTSLTLSLLLLPLLLGASACAHRVETFQTFPSAADLRVEAKPQPSPDILTSAQAEANHNIAIEAWGERGWRTVARVCRWAKGRGMGIDCPPPPSGEPQE